MPYMAHYFKYWGSRLRPEEVVAPSYHPLSLVPAPNIVTGREYPAKTISYCTVRLSEPPLLAPLGS